MATAEELLAALLDEDSIHEHPVVDSDMHFVIDSETRVITNAANHEIVVMQYDHNSERYTFELPRYVDGHDMLLCNRVRVHFNNFDGETGVEIADVAELTDLAANPDDENTVLVSWLIKRQATQLVGVLSFLVQFMCVSDDGTVTYEWHTDIFSDARVKKGRNNDEAVVIEYSNILEDWYQKLFGAGDSVVAEIQATTDEQVTRLMSIAEAQQLAIEAKGVEVLATIPEDYTATYNMANEALRTRANAIVETVEGEVIVADDCSNDNLRGMRIFGKSTQASTTGKNLFNPDTSSIQLIERTEAPHYGYAITLPAGTYTIKATKYMDTYIYAAIDNGDTVSSNLYVILPAEARAQTFTLNDGDTLYLYNAITYTSQPGNREATVDVFESCPIQIEAGTEATEYEPYSGGVASPNPEYPQEIVSVENPAVTVCGKNLCAIDHVELAGSSLTTRIFEGTLKLPATFTYTQDFDRSTGSAMFGFVIDGVWYYSAAGETGGTYTKLLDYGDELSEIMVLNWAVETGNLTNMQLEVGLESTEYEIYKEAQTMSLTRTLPGIPVTSGGNYADANEQQWICDEIDFERGVYIQRVGKTVFDETGDYHLNSYRIEVQNTYVFGSTTNHVSIPDKPVISDKLIYKQWGAWDVEKDGDLVCYTGYAFYFFLKDQSIQTSSAFKEYVTNNPITVYYILATPIETPLTDEELFNFSQLHSNCLTTTIFNDQQAHMDVSYNADTKTYLERLPQATDAQVQAAVDAYLTAHYTSAEGASF